MTFPDCDPRNGGTCANIMAKKCTCAVVGILQVIIWGCSLLALIIKPSSMAALIEELDTTYKVLAVYLIFIACFAFNCLLVFGVFKNNKLCVKIYLLYVAAFIVFLIFDFIIGIFRQDETGFRKTISAIIFILLFILWSFVVRSYYLITFCATPPAAIGDTVSPGGA